MATRNVRKEIAHAIEFLDMSRSVLSMEGSLGPYHTWDPDCGIAATEAYAEWLEAIKNEASTVIGRAQLVKNLATQELEKIG